MNLEPTLAGTRLKLVPMKDFHASPMIAAASDGELWTSRVSNIPGPNTVGSYVAKALAGRAAGVVMPFVVEVDDAVVGSTRFWEIDRENRKLEIGHTWYAASWQRTFVNTETKFLLLKHAFEALGFHPGAIPDG